MAQKMYAYVGNWNFHPADKGISVYVFDPEDGSLELIETIKPEVAAGQIWLHPDKPVLYCVDEVGNRVGELGGGGYVLAFAIDPETGKLTQISRIDSLCPEPCYVVTDKTRKHVLVSSHVDPFNVTKVVKNDDGSWGNKVLMDDAGLLLVGLKDDGSLDAIKDVYITHSNQGLAPDSQKLVDPVTGHIQLTRVLSRQHAVMPSPSGNIFAVPDKGMDRVYTFRVDQENEKIELCDVYQDDLGLFPRYASFHPTLPVLYTNNERKCEVHVFSYDDETGKIALLQKEELLTDEYRGKEYSIKARPMGAQDILAHPNGKALYGDIDPVWVEKLSKAAGVSTDNILITVSHTHTAPFIGGYWPEDVEDVEKSEQYKLLAWETLIEAVKEAMAKAEPVILRYAEGYCDVNICRDNPQIDPETGKTLWRIGRNFKGYSDKTVYTISFEREDGTIAAVLFNYSVHSAVLFDAKMTKGGQLASGDLSGFAMDSVEKALGHEAVAIFTMAPAADQNAKYTAAYTYTGENGQKQNGNYGESSYVLVELQGRDLGEATLAAITQPKTVYHAEQIKTVSETIFVPGKIKKEGRGAKWPESPDEYELSEPVPIPLSVTAIGNLAIVGIGCETSSKNSPEIRKVLAQEGFTDTIIITQCNGSSSYMSDADGYQVVTFSAKASHMMPEAVDILFSSIKRLAAKSAGKNL